jgi:hypothetical protein
LMNQYDYIDAGFRVFGLHNIVDGKCSCGDQECKAAGKHPIASNWQHTPQWSDDQLETMEDLDHFKTGFGVLVDGYLIIDVDARNGGIESFSQLCKAAGLDLLGESGFAVETGSGGGSMHIYYKHDGKPLMHHHNKYKGIDFKSSGYVVGAGSLHKSGLEYEVKHGDPSEVTEAPQELLEILKKPDSYRAHTQLGAIDVTAQQAIDILSHVSPDCDYETWIRCGMALHHTFNGDGIAIWDDWSRKGASYPGFEKIQRHWHSFGKSQNPVQFGTLIHYAEQSGYVHPVTFDCQEFAVGSKPIVDIKRPPGLVGEICDWINASSRYKRESLAVAAAITAIGNIGGLKYIDARDGMTANLLTFCVGASSTGKEHIQQCFASCIRAAGIIDAMHGAIKSEQEIIRNITRHQAAFYSIDELGIVLRKIINSRNASYLEGVIGIIMSAYSKADSFLAVGGDVKEALKSELKNEAAACEKKISENEDKTGAIQKRLEQIMHAMDNISNGIEKPFLSLIGYTTPVTFNSIMDYENATNGFLARATIFEEPETNPKPKKTTASNAIPEKLAAKLQQLYSAGEYDILASKRIEFYADKTPIQTTTEAGARLDEILLEFWEIAEDAKDTGLESIPRRGYELCAKISFILAIPDGLRTLEHVEWAYALTKDDITRKMRLAASNINTEESPVDSIVVKIQGILETSDEGETQGVIINRCRPHKKEAVLKVLAALEEKGVIKIVEFEHKRNKKPFKRYVVS